MAEDLILKATTKEDKYKELLPQIRALVEDEADVIANLANICAALKQSFDFFWVGFYLVKEDQLVLGPFQGPVACTRIHKGKGVCGTSWEKNETVIVPDVEQFPGHIACSALSKSEIVIPLVNSKNNVCGVLDVDSDTLNSFDTTDELYLKQILSFLKF
ncbi:diguanylate cyclase [Sphingobacteriaceae bacterium]|nr:diguanylate cyclase [Sphingobacteriaceae bacterium]